MPGLLAAAAGCSGGDAAGGDAGGGDAPATATVPSSGPRAVTAAEAETLALVRLRNHDAGTRSVRASYRDDGHLVQLQGYYDYATHAGYAAVTADSGTADTITWDGATVAIAPEGCTCPPDEPPASIDGWTVGVLDPARSHLETLLAVLAALGATQPENPLLLAQSGAQWVRDDAIDGRPVRVFAGPGTGGGSAGLRYWVDDGGLARRVEVRLGEEWAIVDLGDGAAMRVQPLPTQPGVTPGTTGVPTPGS